MEPSGRSSTEYLTPKAFREQIWKCTYRFLLPFLLVLHRKSCWIFWGNLEAIVASLMIVLKAHLRFHGACLLQSGSFRIYQNFVNTLNQTHLREHKCVFYLTTFPVKRVSREFVGFDGNSRESRAGFEGASTPVGCLEESRLFLE